MDLLCPLVACRYTYTHRDKMRLLGKQQGRAGLGYLRGRKNLPALEIQPALDLKRKTRLSVKMPKGVVAIWGRDEWSHKTCMC